LTWYIIIIKLLLNLRFKSSFVPNLSNQRLRYRNALFSRRYWIDAPKRSTARRRSALTINYWLLAFSHYIVTWRRPTPSGDRSFFFLFSLPFFCYFSLSGDLCRLRRGTRRVSPRIR